MPTIPVPMDALTRGRASLNGRSQFKSVTAYYRNLDKGDAVAVSVGEFIGDEPVTPNFVLPGEYVNDTEARAAASAKLEALARQQYQIDVMKMPGNPALVAEVLCKTSGHAKAQLNALWSVDSAVHTLDGKGGYTTAWKGVVPKTHAAPSLA